MIESWTAQHPRWTELEYPVESQEQWSLFTFKAHFHMSNHVYVSFDAQRIYGFIRFVVQDIGPDNQCPAVCHKGKPLIEAKILAFTVQPTYRREGHGRQLQEAVTEYAKPRNLHQIRSQSGGGNSENHQLKLSMGFGVHPVERSSDKKGAYFILLLSSQR